MDPRFTRRDLLRFGATAAGAAAIAPLLEACAGPSAQATPIPTPTAKDAVGKKIGLQSGARGPWATILSLSGLKESDMTIVPVQFDPTPLVQGQVDGFWAFAFNQPLVLQAQGLDTVFMTAFDA